MARRRYFLLSVALVLAPFAGAAHAASDDTVPDVTTLSTVDPADGSTTDSTIVWRLENDPSQCIGFLPRPDCGYKPQDAGERGGSLQITLFFVLLLALGVIGTVIVRNTVRRDRALARGLDGSGGPRDA